MSDKPPATFAQQAGDKAERKLRARRRGPAGVWFGLGMMGLVGWSVVVPTLAGAGLGLWLDRKFPGDHSWTLALLVGGLLAGCANAGHWIAKEDKAMHEESKPEDDQP